MTTCVFNSTGTEQTFVVPPRVSSVHVVAVGGTGATTGRAGGRGATVTADLAVTSGTTLYVEVGGNGSGGGTAASGFNGGAPGGNGCCGGVSNGGAGGGATDLRTIPRAQAGSLHSRLLVAAGGGGGGGFGGGAGGAAGNPGVNGGAVGIGGGGAGSAVAGGAAGTGAYGGANGAAGSEGSGGAGGTAGGSGGGGGGFFGGGGGGGGGAVPMGLGTGTGAGGGGGSSFLAPGAQGVVAGDTTGVPQLTITYKQTLYSFTGFFPPVANAPAVNTVKAGAARPIKFSLAGGQGLDVLAAGSPASQQINCDSRAPLGAVEQTTTAGRSSLQHGVSSATYTYVWKTQKSWANTCRQLVVTPNDGSSHTAYFRFR